MGTWKESKLYSIVNFKCPRCHDGELFPANTLYSPKRFSDMHESCPCCGLAYEKEPGFYYGAMYVSFGISTGIFLVVFAVLNLLVEEITLTMIITMILVIVIGLLPINFRLSRAIWINIFESYEGPCSQIKKREFRPNKPVKY